MRGYSGPRSTPLFYPEKGTVRLLAREERMRRIVIATVLLFLCSCTSDKIGPTGEGPLSRDECERRCFKHADGGYKYESDVKYCTCFY